MNVLMCRNGTFWGTFLLLAALLFAYHLRVADADLFGHIAYGEATIANNCLPLTHDFYSFTATGRPWLANHESLTDIVFALLGLGPWLIALKTLVGAATLLLVWRLLAGTPQRAAVWLLMATVLSVYIICRPQIFTYLGFALVLNIIADWRAGRPRAVWLLPALFVLWPQFHGGFVAGLAVLALWWCSELAGPGGLAVRWPRLRWLALFILAAAVLTLVNPYGVRLHAFLYHSLTNPLTPEAITEWHSLLTGGPTWYGLLTLLLLALMLASRRGEPPAGWWPLLAAGMAVVLPLLAVRHIPLAVMLAAAAWGRKRTLLPRLTAALAALATGLTLASVLVSPAPEIEVLPYKFPVGCLAALQQAESTGRIFNEFDWGEYLTYHTYPRLLVALDGRYDSIYALDYLAEAMSMLNAGAWEELTRRWPADHLLIRRDRPRQEMLAGLGWQLQAEDECSRWYTRLPAGSGNATLPQ